MTEFDYREIVDPAGRFLLLAVRASRTPAEADELVRLTEVLGASRCRAVAALNRVESLVGCALIEVTPALVPADWRAAVEANLRRVEGLTRELEGIFADLDRCGAKAATIEGGGMLFGTQYPMAGYGAGDFDLLVDTAHFHQVLAVLRERGFSAVDRRGRPTTRIEHVRRTTEGVEQWIEVGHRPFDRMWLPLGFQDRSQRWLESRMPSLRNPHVRVLAPTEALVLCAAHASLHSYVRSPGMRLHIDTDRVARTEGVDWQGFVDEVRASNLSTRAFVSLIIARALLGTPVPQDALEQLKPSVRRTKWIVELIQSERVLADGKPKLNRERAVLLDVLLDDRGPRRWVVSLLAPEREWMQEHFDRNRDGVGLTRMHLRRGLALARAWRPE